MAVDVAAAACLSSPRAGGLDGGLGGVAGKGGVIEACGLAQESSGVCVCVISKTDSERASEWYGRGRESKTSKRSVCFAVEMINKSSRVACATLGPRFPRA